MEKKQIVEAAIDIYSNLILAGIGYHRAKQITVEIMLTPKREEKWVEVDDNETETETE
jgi:hypothetical protein